MSKIGPKEAQIRALREARAAEHEQLTKRRSPEQVRSDDPTIELLETQLEHLTIEVHQLGNENVALKKLVAQLTTAAKIEVVEGACPVCEARKETDRLRAEKYREKRAEAQGKERGK
jgi:SMC interacting uncharacterized protein involved in chromosome segregation